MTTCIVLFTYQFHPLLYRAEGFSYLMLLLSCWLGVHSQSRKYSWLTFHSANEGIYLTSPFALVGQMSLHHREMSYYEPPVR